MPPSFDASETSNATFDELAERSLMSPLARMKHTYVRVARIIIHWEILTLFQFFSNKTNFSIWCIFKNKNVTELVSSKKIYF